MSEYLSSSEEITSQKDMEQYLLTYQNHLQNFAYQLTQDTAWAEDLYQDLAIKALKNSHQFAPGTHIKGWLFTVMKNIFITQYHKRKRHVRDVELEHIAHIRSVANTGPSDYNYEQLEQIVFSLKPKFLDPFWMYYSGYKYKEIAQILDLCEGTIKSRIHQAREEIKAILAQGPET